MIVSGGQQSGSAIPIYVSILPQTPLPFRLPHNTELSSHTNASKINRLDLSNCDPSPVTHWSSQVMTLTPKINISTRGKDGGKGHLGINMYTLLYL